MKEKGVDRDYIWCSLVAKKERLGVSFCSVIWLIGKKQLILYKEKCMSTK